MLLLLWAIGGLIGWIMTAIGLGVFVAKMIRQRNQQIPTERPRCVCSHVAEAHEHYRPGTDCGTCDVGKCIGYQPVIDAISSCDPRRGEHNAN